MYIAFSIPLPLNYYDIYYKFLGEFSMQNYLEFIGNELKALTSIPSPSGYTKDVAAYLMKTLSDMGYEPQLF